jgi:hypothetical protein
MAGKDCRGGVEGSLSEEIRRGFCFVAYPGAEIAAANTQQRILVGVQLTQGL